MLGSPRGGGEGQGMGMEEVGEEEEDGGVMDASCEGVFR